MTYSIFIAFPQCDLSEDSSTGLRGLLRAHHKQPVDLSEAGPPGVAHIHTLSRAKRLGAPPKLPLSRLWSQPFATKTEKKPMRVEGRRYFVPNGWKTFNHRKLGAPFGQIKNQLLSGAVP